MLSWLGKKKPRATSEERDRAAALRPLESLEPVDGAITFVAGGAQTQGALPVVTDAFDAALYTSKGRGYAPYNEDGALLLRDDAGRMYAGAFDQAGGLGGKVRGAASEVAANSVAECFKELVGSHEHHGPRTEAMAKAMAKAHKRLLDRGEGEVTTGVAAIVEPSGQVEMVSSGDSAALLFDGEGGFKSMTVLHEAAGPQGAGCLTHAIGLEPEGPDVQSYSWTIEAGGVLLLCTDGLLDAGLAVPDLGQQLVGNSSTEELVNDLVGMVLRKMGMYRAKPDNLTVVAIRRKSD